VSRNVFIDWHGTEQHTATLPTDSEVQINAYNTQLTWLLSENINSRVSYIENIQLISLNTLGPMGLLGASVVRM